MKFTKVLPLVLVGMTALTGCGGSKQKAATPKGFMDSVYWAFSYLTADSTEEFATEVGDVNAPDFDENYSYDYYTDDGEFYFSYGYLGTEDDQPCASAEEWYEYTEFYTDLFLEFMPFTSVDWSEEDYTPSRLYDATLKSRRNGTLSNGWLCTSTSYNIEDKVGFNVLTYVAENSPYYAQGACIIVQFAASDLATFTR